MEYAQWTTMALLTLAWNGFGTSIGYHRMLSHRSVKFPKWLEYFFVLGAIMGFQGSPIWWTAIHRSHHKTSDQELDMHSPEYGFRFYKYGWFLKSTYPDHIQPKYLCADLLKDPVYRFLEQNGDWKRAQWLNFFVVAVLGRCLLIPFIGWQLVLVSVLTSMFFFQMPLLFNQICHMPKFGYRNFKTTDKSVNVWWVAVLWFGEGWHNNHHARPGNANMGVRKHEFDISYAVLRLLRACGLASMSATQESKAATILVKPQPEMSMAAIPVVVPVPVPVAAAAAGKSNS